MSVEWIIKLLPTFCGWIRALKKSKPSRGPLLVVEDDPADAIILEHALRRAGHECDIANTAEIAANAVRRNFYAWIFVDLRLPGMSGQDLLRLLQTESPASKLVVITGGELGELRDLPEGFPMVIIKKCAHYKGLTELFELFKLK